MPKEPKYNGNMGEWGELYSLIKLLADGEFYSADNKLQIIHDDKYPIVEAYRGSQIFDGCISFKINEEIVEVNRDRDSATLQIPREDFKRNAKIIFKKAPQKQIPELNPFWQQLFFPKFKAESTDKSDLQIKIYDSRIKSEKKLGFSVKSKAGGKATLFNANKNTTSFIYKVVGFDKLDDNLKEEAFILKNKTLVKWLYDNNCELRYDRVYDSDFYNNLIMVDSCFDHLLAEIVLQSYLTSGGKTKNIIEKVKEYNPCNFPENTEHDFYHHKMNQFLLAAALGMTSKSTWKGVIDATGGFLVIREDGEILCYHIYNWNDLQDYLYNSTFFDQPSTGRHKYGQIERDNPDELLLNFQVRFK